MSNSIAMLILLVVIVCTIIILLAINDLNKKIDELLNILDKSKDDDDEEDKSDNKDSVAKRLLNLLKIPDDVDDPEEYDEDEPHEEKPTIVETTKVNKTITEPIKVTKQYPISNQSVSPLLQNTTTMANPMLADLYYGKNRERLAGKRFGSITDFMQYVNGHNLFIYDIRCKVFRTVKYLELIDNNTNVSIEFEDGTKTKFMCYQFARTI